MPDGKKSRDHSFDAEWLRGIAEYCVVAGNDGERALWPEDIENLGSVADELERLQAENAGLRERLTIDDAMVERAAEAYFARSGRLNLRACIRAALEAAFGTKEPQE